MAATAPCPTVRLANGVDMPLFGLGLSHNGGFSRHAVDHALKRGVRLLDTAKRYGNEQQIGAAVSAYVASGAGKREDVFVSTKLWPGDAGDVAAAYAGSATRLGTHADLYLVHWPGVWGGGGGGSGGGGGAVHREARARCWRDMELLLDAGRVRAIGVSNFLEHHLRDVIPSEDSSAAAGECSGGRCAPMVNQIEVNPFQHPRALMQFCAERNIVVGGYCPLAKGRALDHAGVQALARKHSVSAAALLCRWSLQHGVVTIPKSTSEAHIDDNLTCLTMAPIPDADMATMDGWHQNLRVTWDPSGVP